MLNLGNAKCSSMLVGLPNVQKLGKEDFELQWMARGIVEISQLQTFLLQDTDNKSNQDFSKYFFAKTPYKQLMGIQVLLLSI